MLEGGICGELKKKGEGKLLPFLAKVLDKISRLCYNKRRVKFAHFTYPKPQNKRKGIKSLSFLKTPLQFFFYPTFQNLCERVDK